MPSGLAAIAPVLRGAGVSCAAPRGFRSAEGVRSAWPLPGGPFGRAPRISGSAAQRAGLRYEAKALDALAAILPGFQRSPWYRYLRPAGGMGFCQLDGLLLRDDFAVLFEIKIRHTTDAFFQLAQLYSPVIRAAHGVEQLARVVVCRSFDPLVPWPGELEHLETVELPRLQSLGEKVGVLTWKL